MRFVPAPVALTPWVLGVSVLRTTQPQWVTVPAHALAIWTFVQSGALQVGDQVIRAGAADALFGQGSSSVARQVLAHAGTVSASLLCRASVLPWLAGEAADAFADAPVPAGLLGLDSSRMLDTLPPWRTDVSDADIAAALFAMLFERMQRTTVLRRRAAKFALALARWTPGPVVLPPAGWSERQWQRACQLELGVTPKFLLRLHRLHASVRARLAQGAGALAQHAVQAGFSDQAHMAREYRLLAGIAPSALIVRDAALFNGVVLGARELSARFHAPPAN